MDRVTPFIPKRIREIPLHMDFDGQRKAERYFQVIITIFGVAGFIWGYICQQLSQCMYILFAGVVIASLISLPPWPFYRHKPITWQPERTVPEIVSDQDGTGSGSAAAAPGGSGASGGGGKNNKPAKKRK